MDWPGAGGSGWTSTWWRGKKVEDGLENRAGDEEWWAFINTSSVLKTTSTDTGTASGSQGVEGAAARAQRRTLSPLLRAQLAGLDWA
ncbi:hypothetical protein CVT26_006108 [Gymnopilus dilepis]|uniref:Uncharacterized protein n=1 Tax=Gymnopilus dilepis TaxID=231916 RepID=A0A409X4N8_9AGAR|nr:hypothetical protein CVT26_006108 [Gymnopilus dilepis]